MNEENNLVQRLKGGDELAFSELVTQYQDMVVRLAYAFLKSQEDAEDIAQEVFISVYENIKYFREEANLKTWLYRITINKSINTKKRLKWRNTLIRIEELLSIQHPSLDDFDDPYRQIVKNELYQNLEMSIDRLPKNQRIVFIMHKIENIPQNEIAKVMNMSVPAIESLIHRAKLNLKKYFMKRI